jgi:chloramphenicol 3-O phosphotransferase
MPAKMQASDEGIVVAADGGVSVGADFREMEAAWMDGVVAMARAGARVIIDDAFLGGAASQQRWQKADVEVDTTHTESLVCARTIATHVS